MAPSWCRGFLCVLFIASLLVLSAGALQPSPRAGSRPSSADALLARLCDPRSAHPAPPSLCHGLHLRRRGVGAGPVHRVHHHRPVPVPVPPPGRDGGEEIDVRYGVAKRLVPTGPNPLHN
ncbi:hypothetical protein U9M48_044549 [Paspalum notatum var. saurae]|uniref:Uncharacterized protein n=1 Tax=Paspalum notatum var. saurae TaxID=547442 RepID=A0AAQ3XIE1_PASNO